MPFSVTITRVVCAAHAIRLPDGSLEPLHGHNWDVRVTVARPDGGLDKAGGWVVDFHELEARLDAVLRPFHNRSLNDADGMSDLNPTAENFAYHIARSLTPPDGARLRRVEVTEAPGCVATYEP